VITSLLFVQMTFIEEEKILIKVSVN